jgi:hypothetical protein
MAITLFCPNLKCRAILQVPDNTRGKKVKCGQCGTAFFVPTPKTPVKTPTAPQPESDNQPDN